MHLQYLSWWPKVCYSPRARRGYVIYFYSRGKIYTIATRKAYVPQAGIHVDGPSTSAIPSEVLSRIQAEEEPKAVRLNLTSSKPL